MSLLKFIERFEGKKNNSYICPAGIPTIAIGHALTAKEQKTGFINLNGRQVNWKDGLTDEECYELLNQDLQKFANAVDNCVQVEVNQHERDALISFAYNCGPDNLKTSTLLKRLNEGNKSAAANEFLRWVKAGTKTLNGLVKRRTAERKLFLEGQY